MAWQAALQASRLISPWGEASVPYTQLKGLKSDLFVTGYRQEIIDIPSMKSVHVAYMYVQKVSSIRQKLIKFLDFERSSIGTEPLEIYKNCKLSVVHLCRPYFHVVWLTVLYSTRVRASS